MDATTRGIFGRAPKAESATPGSYGEPARNGLPDTLALGPVHLAVADLGRSSAFYTTTLGLRVVERTDARAMLAPQADAHVLVVLHEQPGVQPMGKRGKLGLYHFAILLPDRAALGHFVRHLGQIGARAGAADHLVSEAFYLQDPDGLGIEVYADRPRATWQRVGRELMMATDPIAIESLLAEAGDSPWPGMPAGTRMGHVHLHVGDIAGATAFYHEALGFDRVVWSYPGALFLSAGGYHHHLGANTWAGEGATPASGTDARLLEWTLDFPDTASLAEAAKRVTEAGYTVQGRDGDVLLTDPWGTPLRLRVAFDPLVHAVPRAVTS